MCERLRLAKVAPGTPRASRSEARRVSCLVAGAGFVDAYTPKRSYLVVFAEDMGGLLGGLGLKMPFFEHLLWPHLHGSSCAELGDEFL